MKRILLSVLNSIKKNKVEFFLLLFILLLAAFFRFYRLPEYMTFLGDEGRDALVIKNMLTTFDFPLLGPPTSFGNAYLGPLYYYMMSVPMFIFGLTPVAAAGMVALIGVMAVGLIYYLSREWFGKEAAVVSSLLYTLSFTNIIYSRSSWNPNPAPFFSLLAILGLYKAHKSKNYRWLLLTGAASAFAIQMHYLALILLPILFILWLYEFRSNAQKNYFHSGTLGSILTFAILMSPLLIFDLKYNFMNYRAFQGIFFSDTSGLKVELLNNLNRVVTIYFNTLVGKYLGADQKILGFVLSFVLLLPLCWFIKGIKSRFGWPLFVLTVWLVVGLLGLSLYKHSVYEHYLGFLSPSIFLLFGSITILFKDLHSKTVKNLFAVGFGIFTISLLIVNLQKNPLNYPPGRQLQRTQEISKFIINESEGKPFNFALIAERNYDAAYQFYMGVYEQKAKLLPFEMTDQLFVVCEDEVCQPINHSKYEIAAFGWAKIESEKRILGVRVFKLVHNPSGTP